MQAVIAHDTARIFALAKNEENIDLATPTGKTALMVAAKAGEYTLVKWLLDNGANPHVANHNGGTPLMFASISGEARVIKLLIEHQVDFNAQGKNGWGALMIAAAKGHTRVVDQLLTAGAKVNTHDVYYWTPLHRAVYEERIEVSKRLLSSPGIRVNARDDQGATALHHASQLGNLALVTLLLSYGADPDIADVHGLRARHYAQKTGQDHVLVHLN